MDNFLGQRAPSSANHDNDAPGLLLSDSQISHLDLSSTAASNNESVDEHGFVRLPLTRVPANQRRPRDPGNPHNQSILSEYGKKSLPRHKKPVNQPSPYDTPSVAKHHHRASRNPAPSNRPHGRALASNIYTSVSLSPDRFEDDAVPIDPRRLPLHPDESQQDVAERINALTQAIQSNTQFCLDLSGQMLTLANQNKHLLPAFSSSVSSAVASYVIKPALRLPGALKTYYPALQDYEDKLRRTIANCANGREMALAQGVGSESDVKRLEDRLKDRLVEQDALLRDSTSHMQRLIRERDALRLQLSDPPRNTDAPETDDGSESSGQKFFDSHNRLERTASREDRQDSAVLADKLRELRILVDQLTLDIASNHDRNGNDGKEQDARHGADGQEDEEDEEEEGDWTLL
ncbi:hypothetical protein PG985_002164 [Apiospora marii]|uniref:DASH complex subunit SPC19 n=1 Tax=Apiospora marii TaxID=335849 RepID=A0ABR1RYZ8_9PEZI